MPAIEALRQRDIEGNVVGRFAGSWCSPRYERASRATHHLPAFQALCYTFKRLRSNSMRHFSPLKLDDHRFLA